MVFLYLLGFEEELDKFLFCMLTLVLVATTASCMAFAISALAPVTTVAIMGMGEATTLQMVCMLYSDSCLAVHTSQHFC